MCKTIVTHPGPAHFDELVAVALLIVMRPSITKIERREPTLVDLESEDVYVVDVGYSTTVERFKGMGFAQDEAERLARDLVLDAGRLNFDHHADPEAPCAYVLVARHLGYEAAMEACFPWWGYRSVMDCRGPIAANAEYGIEGDTRVTMSGVEGQVLRMFSEVRDIAKSPTGAQHSPLMWRLIEELGKGWLAAANAYEEAVDEIEETCDLYPIGDGMSVLHGDVTVTMSSAVDAVRDRMIAEAGADVPVSVLKSPRDGNWSIYRYNDDPRFDMRRIKDEPDVTFAHGTGFLAAVDASATTERLLELVKACRVVEAGIDF